MLPTARRVAQLVSTWGFDSDFDFDWMPSVRDPHLAHTPHRIPLRKITVIPVGRWGADATTTKSPSAAAETNAREGNAPGRTRTYGPRFRKAMLYPTELRALRRQPLLRATKGLTQGPCDGLYCTFSAAVDKDREDLSICLESRGTNCYRRHHTKLASWQTLINPKHRVP